MLQIVVMTKQNDIDNFNNENKNNLFLFCNQYERQQLRLFFEL